jgi:predicted HTH transcriptional regulator
MPYFNTNKLSDEQVVVANQQTKKQEDIILNIFFQRKQKLTASDIYNIYNNPNTPLTSIRRGITNLKNDGKLVKIDETKIGIYGKPEHYYKLNQGQLKLF